MESSDMKTASAKNKGRNLQKWVKAKLLERAGQIGYGLESDDIHSRSMGSAGEDLILSPLARATFPYSFECKNVEKLNVWAAYAQALANSPDISKYPAILVIKRNNQRPLVVMDFEDWLWLI